MVALPDSYRAIVREQQRQLAKLIEREGIGPVFRMYQNMLDEVKRKLARVASGSFSSAQLRGMLAQIKIGLTAILREMSGQLGDAAFKIGMATARAQLEDVARLEAQFSGALVQLPVLETARLRGLVQGQTSSLLSFHQTSLARYGSHLVGRMETALGAALATGESSHEAIDRIMKVGDLEWWRAERIVRTELSYAAQASNRTAIQEQSKELGGDLWMRWNEHVSDSGAPLDDRVGDDSIAMHGQVAPPGGRFTQPPSTPSGEPVSKSLAGESWEHPPNRPNDRSVLTPWRAHWGIPGWIWQGRRVPVTEAMARELGRRRAA